MDHCLFFFPRWRRLGLGPTVFVVGPACHGPLLCNHAHAQTGLWPSDTALIQKICPNHLASLVQQTNLCILACACKNNPTLDKEGPDWKGFQASTLRFYIKTNKINPGRLKFNQWTTAPPWLPNISMFWTHLLILDGQFSENRKAVKAAQLTPGVRAQRESLLVSQAYLLFTHPFQSVWNSPVFYQLVLLNMAESARQINLWVKSVGLISSTQIKCH